MVAATHSLIVPSIQRLQQQFVDVLPRIKRHAAICFRGIRCPIRRDDCISETIALAWKWFVRLMRRGKDATKFVSALASLAVKAVHAGRRLAGGKRANDILSLVAQHRHGFTVESLPASTRSSHAQLYSSPHSQEIQDTFEERLHDNTVTPVPDQVQFRIDWPTFFATLTERDRRLAAFLSWGHTGTRAGREFGLSPGSVTQLRQQWCHEWRVFQGEDERSSEAGRAASR